ncbi:MAG: ORF6N domain-containing protein [Hyphomicrobiaceae bacterium]
MASPLDTPFVFEIDGRRVMRDADVARAFGTETRRVNDAVARNRDKFTDRHTFRLDADQTQRLAAQIMAQGLPDPPTRAGARVFSLNGVARLATLLATPEAHRATDLIIDTFIDVYEEVARGHDVVKIRNLEAFETNDADRAAVLKLRRRMMTALSGLVDTLAKLGDGHRPETAIGTAGGAVIENVMERLRTQGLSNAKLEADTALVLAQAEQIREHTRKTRAEADSIDLENLDKKISLVRKLLETTRALDPVAFVDTLGGFKASEVPALGSAPGDATLETKSAGRHRRAQKPRRIGKGAP